ncbi:hypothetical protein ACS0TY_004349 [Phlomoides rotata]
MFEPEIQEYEFRHMFEVPKLTKRSNIVNRYTLVNSCNGLLHFCVKHAADVCSFLCNPVTNESVKIDFTNNSHILIESQWLGFDSSTNQYKILRIFSCPIDRSMGMGSEVLELPSFSSRYIGNAPLGPNHSWDSSSTVVNGVIHWFDPSQEDIVWFDFEKEMFGDVALPPEEQLGNKGQMSIGVLEGCLALSHNTFPERRVNIWVRETHENEKCWRKKLNVDTTTLTRRTLGEQYKPLQIFRNGELLILLNNNDLVYYDPKNMSFRLVELRHGIHREVVGFTPSFISLKDALRIDTEMVQHLRPRDYVGGKLISIADLS